MPVLTRYDSYLADHRTFKTRASLNGAASWVGAIREAAVARFSELGLPIATRGNEEWKYTSAIPIANTAFRYSFSPGKVDLAAIQALAPWDDVWTTIVFVDGHYSAELSSKLSSVGAPGVMRLSEALAKHPELVRPHLGSLASFEKEGFIALNTAFVHEGAFIHLPKDVSAPAPIHVLYVNTERPEPSVSYPRILVVAESGSKATLIESYVGLREGRYLTDAVVELTLAEAATVDHYRFMRESERGFHVGATRVHQAADSNFSSTSFSRGAAIARNDLHVIIDGPGATCLVNGLYMTSGTQHIDNHIDIDHVAPHTTSREFFKGILDGTSKAVFSGKVVVHKGAIKTNALQTDKNLILSEGAEVDTKPSLEIYADDVKCGHGATAGRIDETTLFYMRSRGLDLETASSLLIHAFAGEIIGTVQVDSFKEYLDRTFSAFSRTLPAIRFGEK